MEELLEVDNEFDSLVNLIYSDILENFISFVNVPEQVDVEDGDTDRDEEVILQRTVVNDDNNEDNERKLQTNVIVENNESDDTVVVKLTINNDVNEVTKHECDVCNYTAWLNTHMKKTHGPQPVLNPEYDDLVELTCRLCVFDGESQDEIDNHMETIHNRCPGSTCNVCEFRSKTKDALEEHVKTKHITVKVNIKEKEQIILSCEVCEYKCRLNIQLKKHMSVTHLDKGEEQGKYKCAVCSFTGNFLVDIWQHRQSVHADTTPEFLPQTRSSHEVAIAYLAEQNLELSEEMETLKKDFKGAFEVFAHDLEANLNALREEATTNNMNLSAAIAGVLKLVETVAGKSTKKPDQVQTQRPTSMPKTYSETAASPPPIPPLPQRPSTASPPPPKTKYQSMTRVLYASDSVGRNVCFPQVEKMTSCSIKTTRAYSSVYDKTAIWPEHNFSDVIKKELDDKAYDCLVMSAPTVDISNLDTSKLKQSDNTEVYQQNVFISCQNMFTTAQNALKEHPYLKKVVIMEHPNRYDVKDVDPIGLKPALAKLANSVFNQLWINSPYKNKINVGNHNLDTSSSDCVLNDMFRCVKTGKHDGVHLYGPRGNKSYTKSVLSILLKNIPNQEIQTPPHQKCPQTVFQNKQKKENQNSARYHQSVKDNNRFSLFNSNLGNL